MGTLRTVYELLANNTFARRIMKTRNVRPLHAGHAGAAVHFVYPESYYILYWLRFISIHRTNLPPKHMKHPVGRHNLICSGKTTGESSIVVAVTKPTP